MRRLLDDRSLASRIRCRCSTARRGAPRQRRRDGAALRDLRAGGTRGRAPLPSASGTGSCGGRGRHRPGGRQARLGAARAPGGRGSRARTARSVRAAGTTVADGRSLRHATSRAGRRADPTGWRRAMISAIVDAPLPAPSRSPPGDRGPFFTRSLRPLPGSARSPPAARVLSAVLRSVGHQRRDRGRRTDTRAVGHPIWTDQVAVNFYASLDGQGGLTCGQRALIGPVRDAPHHRASSARRSGTTIAIASSR